MLTFPGLRHTQVARPAAGVRASAPSRRAATRTVVALALACWVISGFWSSVEHRAPRHTYTSPLAGQAWTSIGGARPRGFFRLDVGLPVMPDSATLWIDADQDATAYVNGQRVNTPNKPGIVRVADINPARDRQIQAFDILPALKVGANGVGLDVVDYEGKSPAFRSRLVLGYSGHGERSMGVQPQDWRSTADVGLTGQQLPGSGSFSDSDFAAVGWNAAVAGTVRSAGNDFTAPPSGFDDPLAGDALATVGQQLVASTVVIVPSGCTSGYVRIASPDAWSLDIDGQLLGTGAGGTVAFGQPNNKIDQPDRIRTAPLTIFDVCSAVGPGRHTLQVRADSATSPRVLVDGAFRTATSFQQFGPGAPWRPVADDRELHVTLHRVPATQVAPTASLVRVVGAPVAHHHASHHLLLAVEIGALIAIAIGLGTLTGRSTATSWQQAAHRVAAGVLPAVALVLLLSQLRHLVDIRPPFPSTPGMLVVVFGFLITGITIALGADSFSQRSRASTRRKAGAHRAKGALRARPYQWAIVAFAAGWALVVEYGIRFQPAWQDELSSLAAAQGIRAHGIPQWPSGFQYWKSELYSLLTAAVGALSHDSLTVLRSTSVLWLFATVLLFGLVAIPLVLPGRPWVGFVATVVFATSPFELAHARDLRMYQMEQFFVLLAAIVLLRAIVLPTTRRVALAALVIAMMYFTHEETFGVLATVPLVLVGLLGLRWLRNWRWWVFGGAALGFVACQLVLATVTRPFNFGVDQSNGPFVKWSPSPFYYLNNVFLTHDPRSATLALITALAVVGTAVGVRRRSSVRVYLAAFWIVPVAVVALILPATQTRYGFLSYTFEFALAACGACDIGEWIRGVLVPAGSRSFAGLRPLLVVSAVAVVLGLMASMIRSTSDYGVAVARLTHTAISHGNADFEVTGRYVRDHLRSGDSLVAATSANLVAYGVGRPPNYWMPYRQGGRLLYLFEKGGHAVDTQYGIPTILDGNDLERVIDAHRRTWLITANGYVGSMLPDQVALLRGRFKLVSESETTSVFLSTT